jgi:hypothetical protein
MWGVSTPFTSRTSDRALWAQENAKPRADPTTTAVKRNGSATMRQLFRNVSSMMTILSKDGEVWKCSRVLLWVDCGLTRTARNEVRATLPGIGPNATTGRR